MKKLDKSSPEYLYPSMVVLVLVMAIFMFVGF
jgi:hypothetical protein